jgi:hypothetical protein
MSYPLGPGLPQSSANEIAVEIWDMLLSDPLTISHAIEAVPNNYYLGPTLLTPDSSRNGVVAYEEMVDDGTLIFLDTDANRQPGVIRPGDEFPMVGFQDLARKFTESQLVGGKFALTDKEIRMDRRDLFLRGRTRLANTLAKIHNARIINSLLTNATVLAKAIPAGAVWTVGGGTTMGLAYRCLDDIRSAAFQIDYGTDLVSYQSSWVLCHPDAAFECMRHDEVRQFAPRENSGLNPLFRKDMTGLAGLDWILHRQMPRDKALVGSAQNAGRLVTELPLFVDTIREETRKRWIIQAGRSEVSVIDQPLAVRLVTGIMTP